MTRRVFQLSVAVMLIVAVGGYWAVLQSVAWVGMAIAYSQEASIGEALKKTFDGQHPCKLCLAVKKGKQAERKHDTLRIQTKLDFVCLHLVAFLSPNFPSTLLSFSDEFAGARSETPLTPPPRRA